MNIEYICCPNCKNPLVKIDSLRIECSQCQKKYSATDTNIPLIVNDKEKIESEIENRKKHKEEWYCDDQIFTTGLGPYRFVFEHRVNYWTGILKKHLGDESVILDYGCGDGANLKILAKLPHKLLIGIDYNLIRLERAVKNLNSPDYVVLGNAFENLFVENSFDVIFCNHVLEHINEDYELLKIFNKALKPGGILLLGVPNEGAFISKLRDFVLQPYIRFFTDHVNFYTLKNLKGKLSKANFEVIVEKQIGFVFPFSFIDRYLKSKEKICAFLNNVVEKYFPSQSDALYILARKKNESAE